MHELSIIANLFEILEEKAREQKSRKIVSLKLQVGALSGVVPELLQSAFDMYRKDTLAEEAVMEIVTVPLQIECLECGAKLTHDDFILSCTRCGSPRIKTLAGTEMFLEKIELEV